MNNDQIKSVSVHGMAHMTVRVIRFLMILIVTGVLIFLVVRHSMFITSGQAVIDTAVIGLRSPIAGNLNLNAAAYPGTLMIKGTIIFHVENPRFGTFESTSQFNNLENSIDRVTAEIKQYLIERKRLKLDCARFYHLIQLGAVALRDLEECESALSKVNANIVGKSIELKHLKERFLDVQKQVVLQKSADVMIPEDAVVWAVLKQDSEFLDMNDEVVQIVYPRMIWVEAFFSERYAGKLSIGQQVEVLELGTRRKWQGVIETVRAGVGRVAYSAPVVSPPQKLKERLVAARIRVDWNKAFTPQEFYGVGRSVEVRIPRK